MGLLPFSCRAESRELRVSGHAPAYADVVEFIRRRARRPGSCLHCRYGGGIGARLLFEHGAAGSAHFYCNGRALFKGASSVA